MPAYPEHQNENEDDLEIKVFGSEDFKALWVLKSDGELEFKVHPDLDPAKLAYELITSAFTVMTHHGLSIKDIRGLGMPAPKGEDDDE